MFFLSFLACEAFYIGIEREVVQDTATPLSPPLQIDIDWDADQLKINAVNVEGYGNIRFGIIESSDECTADLLNGCWTGEDCFNGYPPPEGQEGSARYASCHSIPSADSEYGEDSFVSTLNYSTAIDGVETLLDAVQNLNVPVGNGNTAFPAPNASLSYETQVTYYLEAEIVGEEGENPNRCWTWGVNPSYFDALECDTPLPVSIQNTRHLSLTLE